MQGLLSTAGKQQRPTTLFSSLTSSTASQASRKTSRSKNDDDDDDDETRDELTTTATTISSTDMIFTATTAATAAETTTKIDKEIVFEEDYDDELDDYESYDEESYDDDDDDDDHLRLSDIDDSDDDDPDDVDLRRGELRLLDVDDRDEDDDVVDGGNVGGSTCWDQIDGSEDDDDDDARSTLDDADGSQRYEEMVRRRDADHEATVAHLRPVFDRLRTLGGEGSGGDPDRLSYAAARRARIVLGRDDDAAREEVADADPWLATVLSELVAESSALDRIDENDDRVSSDDADARRSASFPEFVHRYKTVVNGATIARMTDDEPTTSEREGPAPRAASREFVATPPTTPRAARARRAVVVAVAVALALALGAAFSGVLRPPLGAVRTATETKTATMSTTTTATIATTATTESKPAASERAAVAATPSFDDEVRSLRAELRDASRTIAALERERAVSRRARDDLARRLEDAQRPRDVVAPPVSVVATSDNDATTAAASSSRRRRARDRVVAALVGAGYALLAPRLWALIGASGAWARLTRLVGGLLATIFGGAGGGGAS